MVSVPALQDDLQGCADPSVCVQNFRTLLMEAASHNKHKLAELLIEARADVNAVDRVTERCVDVPVPCLSRFIK